MIAQNRRRAQVFGAKRPSFLRSLPSVGGPRWRVWWNLKPDALPRRSIEEAILRLSWDELGVLVGCDGLLPALGNLGDVTLADLMVAMDTYLRRNTEDQHQARHLKLILGK